MGISAILAQFPFTIDVPAGTPIPLKGPAAAPDVTSRAPIG
jgi:hypothetical protein